MIRYNHVNRAEQKANEGLRAENAKLKADLDYIAMMSDVELDEEEEDAEQEL